MDKKRKLIIKEVKFVKATSDKILVRADVQFDGFFLKGFKVLQEGSKRYVTPPSYHSGKGWRWLFRTDSPEDWKEIQNRILSDFESHEMKESVDEAMNDGY